MGLSAFVIFLLTKLCLLHCHPTHPTVDLTQTTASCPDGEDWCDDPHGYPEEEILEALGDSEGEFVELFDDYQHVVREREVQTEDSQEDYTNICMSVRRERRIRASRNRNGDFQFIVNSLNGTRTYSQIVPITVCTNPDQECGHGNLQGVSTKCKQEYRDIRLLVFTRERRLAFDLFTFPSCCVCLIKSLLYR